LGLDINEPDALPGSLTHAKNQGVFDGCDQREPESDKCPESFFFFVFFNKWRIVQLEMVVLCDVWRM